jgi:mannose-6-phosphate isomerase
MQRIVGVVQHYVWGDRTAIPELLGIEPDGRPWAEYWLGTHPGGMARTAHGTPLVDESGELPYLVKLLAAGEALSLQTHPSTEQALRGHAREDAVGLAVDDPRRIYRDTAAKPELVCALTAFDALCGFRDPDATGALLDRLGAAELAWHLEARGLAVTVTDLYRQRLDIDSTIAACRESAAPEATLVAALAEQYPDDPSVVVTLLLNRVQLEPGEALYLTPGNLHAYLHGVAVEVMGASDNVVRGGMTVKHFDVAELLDVLDISPLDDPVRRATTTDNGWSGFSTPGAPFAVQRIDLDGRVAHRATGRELLLCTSGDVGPLTAGQACYLGPDERIELSGTGTVYRVDEATT